MASFHSKPLEAGFRRPDADCKKQSGYESLGRFMQAAGRRETHERPDESEAVKPRQ